MSYFQNIISIIYAFFKKTKNIKPKSELTPKHAILRCNFLIDSSEKVRVSFDWPKNINESNLEEISYISSYFLFLLNNGFLKDEILNSLKNSHDPTDAIMYQNIMFHSRFIEIEAKSIIESKNTSDPLIKPSAVFSRKQ